MKCLIELFDLLVLVLLLLLFLYACIGKELLGKGTVVVNIQRLKCWVTCPVVSWKNYISLYA